MQNAYQNAPQTTPKPPQNQAKPAQSSSENAVKDAALLDLLGQVFIAVFYFFGCACVTKQISVVYVNNYGQWLLHVLPVWVVLITLFFILLKVGLLSPSTYYSATVPAPIDETVEDNEPYLSIRQLHAEERIWLGDAPISATHAATKLTPARYDWIIKGVNNSNMAKESDLIKAGYTITD